jgi:hypothetical protein
LSVVPGAGLLFVILPLNKPPELTQIGMMTCCRTPSTTNY